MPCISGFTVVTHLDNNGDFFRLTINVDICLITERTTVKGAGIYETQQGESGDIDNLVVAS